MKRIIFGGVFVAPITLFLAGLAMTGAVDLTRLAPLFFVLGVMVGSFSARKTDP